MKFIILTTLLFAFKALAEEEIVCQSGCPTNLQNPICLQVQDKAGKIIKKVDVDSQCQLDKYKCDNKILHSFTSEGPCSKNHPTDNYKNCDYPDCIPDSSKRCVKNFEDDDVTLKFTVFKRNSCEAQIYACQNHLYHYEISECPNLPPAKDLELNG